MDTNNTKQTPTEETPLSPEEIKAIGEIELGPAKHEVFLNKHYKKLIIGGVALIAAATAGIAWYAYGEQQEEDASSALISACRITNESATPNPAAYDEKALKNLKEEYPDTNAARSADVFLMQQQMTGTAPKLELCKKMADSSEPDEYRLPACMHLATYYMNNGQQAEAVTYLKKIVEMPANAYKNHACKYLAQICMEQGDKAQAEYYLEQMNNQAVDDSYIVLKDMLCGGYVPTVVKKQTEKPSDMSATPKEEDIFSDSNTSDNSIFTEETPSSLENEPQNMLEMPSTLQGVGTTEPAPLNI